ncbi:MAG: hypothetical protein ABR591_14515 [Candidatus Velthaea sp.]
MKTLLAAAALVLSLTAQAPDPYANANASPAPMRTTTVVCDAAPLFIWTPRDLRPYRSYVAHSMHLGERVEISLATRSTVNDFQLYETSIPISESGYNYAGQHYWIPRTCVPPPARAK